MVTQMQSTAASAPASSACSSVLAAVNQLLDSVKAVTLDPKSREVISQTREHLTGVVNLLGSDSALKESTSSAPVTQDPFMTPVRDDFWCSNAGPEDDYGEDVRSPIIMPRAEPHVGERKSAVDNDEEVLKSKEIRYGSYWPRNIRQMSQRLGNRQLTGGSSCFRTAPVSVTICNTEFFIHGHFFRDLFPLEPTESNRKVSYAFEGGSGEVFDAILAFIYSDSEVAMSMLGLHYFEVLRDFAMKHKSSRLLEGVLRAFYMSIEFLSDRYLTAVTFFYSQGQPSEKFQDWFQSALYVRLPEYVGWGDSVPDWVVLRLIKHFGAVPELLDACRKAFGCCLSDEQRSTLETRKQQALEMLEIKSDKHQVDLEERKQCYGWGAYDRPQVSRSCETWLRDPSTSNNGDDDAAANEGFGGSQTNFNCDTPKYSSLNADAGNWGNPSPFQPAVLKTPSIGPSTPNVPFSVVPSRQPTVPPAHLHQRPVFHVRMPASWTKTLKVENDFGSQTPAVPTPLSTTAQSHGKPFYGGFNLSFIQRSILSWLHVHGEVTRFEVANGVGCFEMEASEALRVLVAASYVRERDLDWSGTMYYSITPYAQEIMLDPQNNSTEPTAAQQATSNSPSCQQDCGW